MSSSHSLAMLARVDIPRRIGPERVSVASNGGGSGSRRVNCPPVRSSGHACIFVGKDMTASASPAQIEAATAYEEQFVPALFRPWAPMVADLAQIKAGDRVLDVACGTGVLAREAAARTGQKSLVAGLDPHAGMLAVASDLPPRSTGGTERPRRCRSRIGPSTSSSVSSVSCSLRTAKRRSTRCCA